MIYCKGPDKRFPDKSNVVRLIGMGGIAPVNWFEPRKSCCTDMRSSLEDDHLHLCWKYQGK